INAGSVNVVAGGTDDNFAAGTPGSVGALAIAAAELNTDSTDTQTKAEIGNGAHITVTRAATQMSGESAADYNAFQGVAGTFTLAADHLTRANTRLTTSAYGLLSGAGASASNDINSK